MGFDFEVRLSLKVIGVSFLTDDIINIQWCIPSRSYDCE